jgi:hypothetical protein
MRSHALGALRPPFATTFAAALLVMVALVTGAPAQTGSSAPPESLATATSVPADTLGAGGGEKGAAPATGTPKHLVNHLYDKFQVGAYGAAVILSSTIRVDNSDGTRGTEINRGVMGLPRNSAAPLFSAQWRPGHRHELSFTYLGIGRSGQRTLSKTIDFADTSFTAGLKVDSKFSAPTVFLGYRFAVMAKENTLAGLQLGLGMAFFDMSMNAIAGTSVTGGDSTIVKYGASVNVPGPTVALGLFGQFRASNHWYLVANGGAIGVSVENITARTWVLGGGAAYYISNRVGFTGNYNYSGIKVTANTAGSGGLFDPDLTGSLKYTCQSFSLGVTAAFH